jgi:hypothetical protein
MLSKGADPDLPALEEQQYLLMVADYKRINADRDFPLKTFSSHVMDMRLNDRPELPVDQMLPEMGGAGAVRRTVFRDHRRFQSHGLSGDK